jgi:hypothetical protein
MVVVPFLRNNPSAVMFFQRFIFSAQKFGGKYLERIWVFHCKYSIRQKPRVIVLALPSKNFHSVGQNAELLKGV